MGESDTNQLRKVWVLSQSLERWERSGSFKFEEIFLLKSFSQLTCWKVLNSERNSFDNHFWPMTPHRTSHLHINKIYLFLVHATNATENDTEMWIYWLVENAQIYAALMAGRNLFQLIHHSFWCLKWWCMADCGVFKFKCLIEQLQARCHFYCFFYCN